MGSSLLGGPESVNNRNLLFLHVLGIHQSPFHCTLSRPLVGLHEGISGPYGATFLHGTPGYSPELPLGRRNVPPWDACQPAARWLMTQLPLQPLSDCSNLINGSRRVRDTAPAAPPCPGGARAQRGGCSCPQQGNGSLARQMCVHQGQMWWGTSRLGANLHVEPALHEPPSAGQQLPKLLVASATRVPCPRESHQEQVRTAPPDACSAFCLPCTSGNTWPQEQVGRNNLFSPWLAARGDLKGLMVFSQPRCTKGKKN